MTVRSGTPRRGAVDHDTVALRWFRRLGAAIGLVVVLTLAGAAFEILRSGISEGPEPVARPDLQARRAVEDFERSLAPLVEEGASVVALGMRPGTADVAMSAFDDHTLLRMTGGWLATMRRLEAQFLQVSKEGIPAAVIQEFGATFRGYKVVAERLSQAARATGDIRVEFAREGAELGNATDRRYDRARSMLDELRARLGLSADGAP